MGRRRSCLTQNFVDERHQQEPIGLKECFPADPISDAVHLYHRPARAFDRAVFENKGGRDRRRAHNMNFSCAVRIHGCDELIQLRNQ